MRGRSIRFRLTLWYAAVLTAALALFGGLIWFSLRNRLIGEIDRELAGSSSRFEAYFRDEAATTSGRHLLAELTEFSQALPPAAYVDLRGANGFAFRYPVNAAPDSANVRVLRREFVLNGQAYDLATGASTAEAMHTLELLRLLLLSLVPFVVAIASLGGAWLSRRALKPVHDITAAARTISIENLSDRLTVPATGDEIARLSEVLNIMFARLESAVKTLSQFVGDASHELRTPLAVIRTTAELALRRARSPESYRGSLEEIVAESERMTRMVEDLLVLARSDAHTAEMPLAPLDVREVLEDVREEMSELANLRRIRLKSSLSHDGAIISGNRPALHRLFVALLDNALKFSREGGEVLLSVEHKDAWIAVIVEDFGAGIHPSDLPHIFKRFYRADPARSGGGHGLGLSLAQSIAVAHHATIEVHSVEGAGSTFRVLFKARDAQPEAYRPADLSANLQY